MPDTVGSLILPRPPGASLDLREIDGGFGVAQRQWGAGTLAINRALNHRVNWILGLLVAGGLDVFGGHNRSIIPHFSA
jgi:hypothetical protein